MNGSLDQYHVFRVFQQNFIVDKRFQLIKGLGQGAYGIVCSAKYLDGDEGEDKVAIKKITNIFSKKILCKRALREIKLLRHFRGHKNITCLYDLDIVPDANGNFNEVYLYEELMECDMHQIIRSGQPLTDAHFQSFIYQTLCGLKYIHSADVLHRDLKPGNLLVNADCELKICDFGLARGYSSDPTKNNGFMTEYVATRWYRAPEIILSFQGYTKAIDMWSAGCILAELLGRRTIFKGKDYVDQLNQILRVLGTPDEKTIENIKSPRARAYVRSLPYMPRIPFETLYPDASPLALDLLSKLLTLDPKTRITAEQALEHPYLEVWHDPNDEPVCPRKFDFSFESVDDIHDMKKMIVDEVAGFREYVRKPLEEQERIYQEEQQREEQVNQTSLQQQQQHSDFERTQQNFQIQSPQETIQESPGIMSPRATFASPEATPQVDLHEHPSMQGSLRTPTGASSNDPDIPPRPEEATDDGEMDLEHDLVFGAERYN
ncbi:Mitogen-activated protein kinase slt2/MPK1 [Brettanomyces bruxellensis]|uniref:Mitogen-activated protein kinase n=1 Tax=Dekkera bruxellensis TaxID=5007 RepID=A0A7D9H167_DEKBR|nr:Mitogen-activated protein kinase slt2/MPK1 [Brettanomyces bruxellensis]VUG17504.1 SLT2 [Brettanomyces bruxellensis]